MIFSTCCSSSCQFPFESQMPWIILRSFRFVALVWKNSCCGPYQWARNWESTASTWYFRHLAKRLVHLELLWSLCQFPHKEPEPPTFVTVFADSESFVPHGYILSYSYPLVINLSFSLTFYPYFLWIFWIFNFFGYIVLLTFLAYGFFFLH